MRYDQAGMQKLLSDGRFSDVGNLPSNFIAYRDLGVTKLYARPFTVNELRLISRGAVLKDASHIIRAIDLCISMDAGELTIGDYYYLMMWMRIHSMPKTPYVMEWECAEALVIERATGKWLLNDHTFVMPEDEENYRVEECSTANTEIIHMSQVEIVCLEDDFAGLPEGGPLEFDFPRAKLLQSIREARANPELKMLVEAAQWIKGGNTIEEKVSLLETQGDLQVFDDAGLLNKRVVHGVVEHVKLTCRKCQVSEPHKLVIDEFTFFR